MAMMTQSRCQRPPRGRPAQTFRWGFFFPFPSRAEDTQVVGAAVRLSPPQLVGEDHVGGGHFQRKVRATYLRWPPCWKMITSISLSNMAVTGKDFPSLVCKNTRHRRHIASERVTKCSLAAAAVSYLHCKLLPGTQAFRHRDGELLFPAQLQRISVLLGQELKRHDAHAHQLVLVQPLEALGNDRAYALSERKTRTSKKK